MQTSFLNFSVLNILFLLANCESNDPAMEKVYRFSQEITVDGITRTYLLNLSPDYYEEPSHFPLVIGLHGTGGSALQFDRDYGLTQRADNSGFIVVYPEGVQSNRTLRLRTWNAGTCCDYAKENNVNDVKFISELIDELISGYKIDPKKVYVTGMSNGGMLAYRLACEIPEKIAAIAPVSCSMMVEQPCKPARAVPILHIHSMPDTKVPYSGGTGIGGYYFPSVDSVLRFWADNNSCAITAKVLADNSGYTLTRWSACADEATIQCYLTKDGGHAWPGGLKSSVLADTPSAAINATDVIWDFFQRYQLP